MEWQPQGGGRVLVGDYHWFEATATCCKINAISMAHSVAAAGVATATAAATSQQICCP